LLRPQSIALIGNSTTAKANTDELWIKRHTRTGKRIIPSVLKRYQIKLKSKLEYLGMQYFSLPSAGCGSPVSQFHASAPPLLLKFVSCGIFAGKCVLMSEDEMFPLATDVV